MSHPEPPHPGPEGYLPPPQGYPSPYPPAPAQEDVTWAVLSHLSLPISAAVGITFVFGPLLVMLIAGPQRPFTRAHAVEALNFQLTLLIGIVVSIPLMFVVVGFFTLAAILVAGLVYSILGAVAASRHESYRYPLTIRMVS